MPDSNIRLRHFARFSFTKLAGGFVYCAFGLAGIPFVLYCARVLQVIGIKRSDFGLEAAALLVVGLVSFFTLFLNADRYRTVLFSYVGLALAHGGVNMGIFSSSREPEYGLCFFSAACSLIGCAFIHGGALISAEIYNTLLRCIGPLDIQVESNPTLERLPVEDFPRRSWLLTLALAFFLGPVGADRFYTGRTWLGLLKLSTLGVCGLWSLVDVVLILTGSYRDSEGRPLRSGSEDDPADPVSFTVSELPSRSPKTAVPQEGPRVSARAVAWTAALVVLALLAGGGYWWMDRVETERARLQAEALEAQRRTQEELAEVRRRAAEELEREQERRRAAEEQARAQQKAMDDLAAAQRKLDASRDDEATMRGPIDALYQAWRSLDPDLYSAQWAPNATRTDLKSGKTSTAEQVIRSRSALFPKLLSVDAEHTSRLLSVEDGVAHFYTRYTMSITSQNGRTTTEVANESYRVKKFNGRWLIIENRDYELE